MNINKKYWNENLKNMESYEPGFQPKITSKTIKLNTNENPFPPSSRVFKSIKKQLDKRLRLYPPSDWKNLKEIISKEYNCNTNNIFCSNGSDELLSLVFRSFTEKGETVILTYPTYSLYSVLASANGIKTKYINTNDNFKIDFGLIPKEGYPLAIIANPNAPTGIYEKLEFIEEFVAGFKGVVLIDEAYIDFTDNPENNTALNLIHKFDNLIVSRTFSKSFSLCGLRVGYSFANKNLIDALMISKDSYNLDLLAQIGAEASIKNISEMKKNADRICRIREKSIKNFIDLGFEIIPSDANFIFLRHKNIEAEKIYNELKKIQIYIRYFKQNRIDNYLRISIGKEKEMKKLFKSLKTILFNLKR